MKDSIAEYLASPGGEVTLDGLFVAATGSPIEKQREAPYREPSGRPFSALRDGAAGCYFGPVTKVSVPRLYASCAYAMKERFPMYPEAAWDVFGACLDVMADPLAAPLTRERAKRFVARFYGYVNSGKSGIVTLPEFHRVVNREAARVMAGVYSSSRSAILSSETSALFEGSGVPQEVDAWLKNAGHRGSVSRAFDHAVVFSEKRYVVFSGGEVVGKMTPGQQAGGGA